MTVIFGPVSAVPDQRWVPPFGAARAPFPLPCQLATQVKRIWSVPSATATGSLKDSEISMSLLGAMCVYWAFVPVSVSVSSGFTGVQVVPSMDQSIRQYFWPVPEMRWRAVNVTTLPALTFFSGTVNSQ